METTGQVAAKRDVGFLLEPDNTLIVRIAGRWNIADGLAATDELKKRIGASPGPEQVAFDTTDLGEWDSSLLSFLTKLKDYCLKKSISVAGQGLPEGVAKLLALASAVPEKKDAGKAMGREPFLSRVGEATLKTGASTGEMLAFIGEACLALLRLLRGNARFRLYPPLYSNRGAGKQGCRLGTGYCRRSRSCENP